MCNGFHNLHVKFPPTEIKELKTTKAVIEGLEGLFRLE